MTYKDVVNRVQSVVNDHLILADFGYGDISDLKTRFENTSGDNQVQADYPYAFLNPGQHSRNQSAVTYNFNLIVMDMARGEVSDDPYSNMLTIQSQCQQYIDDIIARLYYYYKDQPQVLFNSMTYTPFNERFQDDVAGMTANLQILVPNAIDECVAPYTGVSGQLVLDVNTTENQQFNPSPEAEPVISFKQTIVDTFNGMRPLPNANFYNIEETGYYTFVLTGTARRTTDNYTPFTTGFNMYAQWPDEISNEATISDWPTGPAVGVDFQFELIWSDYYLPASPNANLVLFNTPDETALEDEFLLLSGANLKAYYTAT